ncbi:MAG TPA: hypothetical protein VGR95_09740 [Thermoanaerobaculia bacterium]|jgi:hypothetical protein|nr:hypothetical protein [Thermoanaerobaculia bacterium]
MNDEPLRTLEEMVFASFGPLCQKAGLTHVGSLISRSQCLITFEGSVSGLAVYFEPGTGVWVQVGRVHKEPGDRRRREFYDLSFFLDERAPSDERPPGFVSVHDSGVRTAIEDLARKTSAYAMDVLNGDFAILPKIRARAEENLRITEARLYRH